MSGGARPDGRPAFHHDDPGTPEEEWSAAPVWAQLPHVGLPADRDRLVVAVAHPDDETLIAGGLVHRAAAAGWRVDVVVATDGARSHPDSPTHTVADLRRVRTGELRDAVAALSPAAVVHRLDLPDGDLSGSVDAMVGRLTALVGDGGRTLLVTTWRHDGHPDHAAAAMACAVTAWRTDALLWEAPVWAWLWSSPDRLPWDGAHLVDLDPSARDAKQRALGAHRSQHQPLSDDAGDEALLSPGFLRHFERDVELFWPGRPERSSPFDRVHTEREDPWQAHSSWYEQRKRAVALAALPRRRYRRAVEIGCSVGVLTRDLATRCDELVAVDESEPALERARGLLTGTPGVELRHADLPEQWPAGTFDLVVLSETGYYLSPARLDRLVEEVVASLTPGGSVLVCHWWHEVDGWPLDGARVHQRLRDRLGWPVLIEHTETDFRLLVWERPGGDRTG